MEAKYGNYAKVIRELLKDSGESLCVHEISERTNVPERSVSGLLYFLKKNGEVEKCNEGQKDTCRFFKTRHYFWSYAGKQEREAKRSYEVGQQLREEHQKEMKRLHDEYEKQLSQAKQRHDERLEQLKKIHEDNLQGISKKLIDMEVLKKKLETEMLRTRIFAQMLNDILRERNAEIILNEGN